MSWPAIPCCCSRARTSPRRSTKTTPSIGSSLSDPDYIATRDFQRVFGAGEFALLLVEADDPLSPAVRLQRNSAFSGSILSLLGHVDAGLQESRLPLAAKRDGVPHGSPRAYILEGTASRPSPASAGEHRVRRAQTAPSGNAPAASLTPSWESPPPPAGRRARSSARDP